MIIEVVLLSTTDEVRNVDVPQAEVDVIHAPLGTVAYKEALCDRAFLWGQNDFQPRRMPSVSVGDVVILKRSEPDTDGEWHDLFRVASVGFDKLTRAEFEEYKKLGKVNRVRHAYGFGDL